MLWAFYLVKNPSRCDFQIVSHIDYVLVSDIGSAACWLNGA